MTELSVEEWEEKREKIAREIHNDWTTDGNGILMAMYRDFAESALTALGFTREVEFLARTSIADYL